MNRCPRVGSVMLLGWLALSGIGSAAPPAGVEEERAPLKPATERTLRLPDSPYSYVALDLPAHFNTRAARQFDNMPANNPVTDHGATLGRVLFYDTRLSVNNTIACGSCHLQSRSFVDSRRFSKGFEGQLGDRNAMSLVNLRFYPRGRFFWDERARNLEEQVLMPIQSRTELGQDVTRLTEILAQDAHYPELFRRAFGDSTITRDRLAKAIAQFLRALVSYQSKYD